MRRFVFASVVSLSVATSAQAPQPEVYLASVTITGTQVTVGTPLNISRNSDYDNQPSFVPDGSAVLFSSKRDGAQNDIYRYILATKTVEQVTKTAESEYSPLVTPDRKTFSTVRVEADGAQRLWRFDLDGANPRLVLERVKPVGYHVWLDATHLGLFVLGAQGEPSTLQLADTTTGMAQVVATSIARSLLVRPGSATMSFISTPRGEPRLIKTIHAQTRAIETVGPALDGSQDAVWWPDGRLVMARGRVLYALTPGASAWTELATLVPSTSANFDQISRLALSPDGRWIAFAAEPR